MFDWFIYDTCIECLKSNANITYIFLDSLSQNSPYFSKMMSNIYFEYLKSDPNIFTCVECLKSDPNAGSIFLEGLPKDHPYFSKVIYNRHFFYSMFERYTAIVLV